MIGRLVPLLLAQGALAAFRTSAGLPTASLPTVKKASFAHELPWVRCGAPQCRKAALFTREELSLGDIRTGLIFKLTDYGAFVKLGHEQHIGLIHVKTVSSERLPREQVAEYLEDAIGPIGSKVSCEIISLQYRGRKQVSLRLLEVVKQQRMEDLVFAPGPRRLRRNGVDAPDDVEVGEEL